MERFANRYPFRRHAMQTCPLSLLLRCSVKPRRTAPSRAPKPAPTSSGSARRWLAVSMAIVGLTGWHALQDLLNAIPDSNDDFGLF